MCIQYYRKSKNFPCQRGVRLSRRQILPLESTKRNGVYIQETRQQKYIYEQTNILEQRHTYLQTIRKLRQEHKNLVYTDETWVNAHHNNEYIWLDSDGSGGWKVPSGKGRRLIILHAGGVDG